jgi:hypothetical protein
MRSPLSSLELALPEYSTQQFPTTIRHLCLAKASFIDSFAFSIDGFCNVTTDLDGFKFLQNFRGD